MILFFQHTSKCFVQVLNQLRHFMTARKGKVNPVRFQWFGNKKKTTGYYKSVLYEDSEMIILAQLWRGDVVATITVQNKRDDSYIYISRPNDKGFSFAIGDERGERHFNTPEV